MSAEASGTQAPLALVVDDDPALRLLIRAKLRKEGVRVAEAGDGAEALEAFDRIAPDIVLLDVVMPRLDGFATCRALRGRAQGRRTPILMLTGLDDVESIDRAYDAGATDFLPKPINWPMLGHRLRYILRTSAAVNELAASQARLARSQRVARLGSWEWDAASGRVCRSDETLALAGVAAERFPATLPGLLDLVRPEDRGRILDAAARCLGPAAPDSIEFGLLRADGAIRAVHCHLEREVDESGAVLRLHGTVQDVTERKLAEERIRHLAYFDAVTGLPNRSWLLERLDQMIARAGRRDEKMAVLFLDLDQFKRINDTLGHSAGDAMLGQVARRIESSIRREDALGRAGADAAEVSIARLGGDEFCVLLEGVGRVEDAARVAKRLLEAFGEPFTVEGFETFVSASIGIAIHPHDGADGSGLLKAADAAMYHAKERGRNNHQFYSHAFNERAAERLTLENELRRALERDEFTLHYQPKVHGITRRLVGLEALVRWNHPARGLVMPGQFIPVAEECRQILRIDEWVLGAACRQNRAWQDAGGEAVPVSVNLSGHQFARPGLVEVVARTLEASRLDPVHLTLEVTEGVLMADHEVVSANLRRLKAMGVRLSLDDFGTGYSSLSYLKRLPLDEIKIDQSFTRDIVGGADSAAIVAAIVAIGRTLNLELVAEGVETEAQRSCLIGQGCEVMQGYLFGRPQPVEAVAGLLGARVAAGAPDPARDEPGYHQGQLHQAERFLPSCASGTAG
ncbi:MAG: EAL domain-containing protein [Betaproteobacteria bacterium]|nr:EAL domain-containing protein [Betaproteobacteria bacterium]